MLKVSIVLLAFNQAEYIETALLSALNQDYSDLEILIGDDASTDATRSIIERVLRSHPRAQIAKLFPSAQNLGLIGNWERLIWAATGDIIVAQAGDDVSLPQRTSRIVEIFSNHQNSMAVLSQVRIIDSDSKVLHEFYEKKRPRFSKHKRGALRTGFDFWCGAPVIGACAAYRCSLRDFFGPLKQAPSEDEAYVYRALLLGDVVYTNEVLLEWRWHGRNLSSGSLLNECQAGLALQRRANSFLARQKGCEQHAADLYVARDKKAIELNEFEKEIETINSVSALQRLGYATLSKELSFSQWCACGWKMLEAEPSSLRCWGYVLRSFVKRLLPQSLKLKYSRPGR